MLFDGMIMTTTQDRNGIEFVSRDVERSVKTAPDQSVAGAAW
jgi:hypothetical protein